MHRGNILKSLYEKILLFFLIIFKNIKLQQFWRRLYYLEVEKHVSTEKFSSHKKFDGFPRTTASTFYVGKISSHLVLYSP